MFEVVTSLNKLPILFFEMLPLIPEVCSAHSDRAGVALPVFYKVGVAGFSSRTLLVNSLLWRGPHHSPQRHLGEPGD